MAKKRKSRPLMMMEFHDPEGDLHTLKRASEIKADPERHGRAVKHGQAELEKLKVVVRHPPKPKRPTPKSADRKRKALSEKFI
ncbi:MAG: hypothetical protein ACYCOR_17915 [Acidobacteriaceae bacterium]